MLRTIFIQKGGLTGETIAQQSLSRTSYMLSVLRKIHGQNGKMNKHDKNDLEKAVKQLVNMSINLVPETTTVAWCLTPRLRREHVLSSHHTEVPKEIKFDGLMETVDIEGSKIDTLNGYLLGGFSKVTVKIGINFPYLVNKVHATPEELLVVLLHEMGHAFNNFLTLHTIGLGNLLIDLTMEQDQRGFKTNIYKNLPEGIDKETQATLLSAKDTRDAIDKIKWITALKVKRFNRLNYYDDNNSEVLAQTFAGRWGYNLAMLSLSQKLHEKLVKSDNNIFNHPQNLATGNYIKYLDDFMMNRIKDNPSEKQIAVMLAYSKDIRNTGGFRYPTYRQDQLNTLRQMINRIRTLDGLTKAEKRNLIDDFDQAKALLAKIPKDKEPYLGKVADLFKSVISAGIAVNTFQENIKALIDNELYVEAERLLL